MTKLARKLHERFLKQIHFKSDKYSTQDSVYLFTLYLAIAMVTVSCITNYIIGLADQVKILAFISDLILVFLYYLARFRQQFRLSKILFFILATVALNILWFYTEGSAGSAIFILHAMLPLIALFSSKRQSTTMVIIIATNIITLLIFEILYPQFINHYPSPVERALDILTISFFFLVFEIPAIIYINHLMLEEKRQAEQSDAAKTSYITNLSHEIRTPMNAILGFTELLSDPDLNREEHEQFLSIINQNGRQLLNLLNNIINISKLETNVTNVSVSEFHPIDVLKQVHDTMIPYFQANEEVQLKVTPVNGTPIAVKSDPTLIQQIILNLTFNAVKFTNNGVIEIGYSTNNQSITFFVKDTGIGIPPEMHNDIFSRHKQVESHNGLSPIQGSGLGLAICKGMTELLDGEIWFTSIVNEGSEFFVRIPLVSKK